MSEPRTITRLPQLVAALSTSEKAVFERLFLVSSSTGEMQTPDAARQTLIDCFGSVEAGLKQTIIKVTNRVTLETSLFNPLRGLRPLERLEGDLEQLIEEGKKTDQFERPLEQTFSDVFGRIETEHSLTASNIAKADGWHSVVIFKEYHPLKFSSAQVIDYLMTARLWAEKAAENDPKAAYFFFLWNCLWKAGASQTHGHAQAMLGRDMHYGLVERLRRDTQAYEIRYKQTFFAELVKVSRALALTADPADRVKAVASLTPLREREIWLITDDYSPDLGKAIHKVLDFYYSIGVRTFNVAIQMPPIRPVPESWAGFPVIARIVARGNPLLRPVDVGAIELFGASIIAGDPFKLAEDFRNWLRQNP